MADQPSQQNAIYHEQSPMLVLAGKIYAGVTAVMVLLAVLFSFILGAKQDGTFNLLGINLIISTIVIAFLMWWYRTGDLAPDKLWFIVLVASIILFQCITTDIYVWNHEKVSNPPAPTTIIAPTFGTKPPGNMTTPRNPNATTGPPSGVRSKINDLKFATLPNKRKIQEKKK